MLHVFDHRSTDVVPPVTRALKSLRARQRSLAETTTRDGQSRVKQTLFALAFSYAKYL